VQTRKLYADAQVVPPAACRSETQTRTCRNTGWSGWSGTFKAESCTQAAVHSCGDIAHGATESRERYASATVNDFELCAPEEQTRECDDGTLGPWSGTATATACEVSFLGHCNVISDIKCVATTSCSFKLTGSQCLGATAHACAANAECASGVCVNGSCAAAKVPSTGACDETADCAPCAGSIAAICTASNVCACGVGATCSNNNQCQGTCVASRCVAPNTTCDSEDDCPATSKCVKSGSGSSNTGVCLLKDGQSCTANAQCQNVCRPSEANELFLANQKVCAPKGTGMSGMEAHCDENADCMGAYVCRPWAGQTVTGGTHCQAVAAAGDFCDETIDCAQTPTTATCNTASSTCVLTLIPSGSPCLLAAQCASGVCDIPMGSATGTCQ
jgi:hypothetical protein